MKKSNYYSVLGRGYNFISRVSNSFILHSVTQESVSQDLDNLGLAKPEATKALIDEALKAKSLSKIEIDLESETFRKKINRLVLVKNLKQKTSFVVGSLPMFKTLQDISIKTALNPAAQLPVNLQNYFGLSMPAFIALHITEHLLPPGLPRNSIKCVKVVMGLPFCVMSECVDKVTSVGLKGLKFPDTSLDMQGTIGVPSDLKLQDVLQDMQRWNEGNEETLNEFIKFYNKQRNKELGSNK